MNKLIAIAGYERTYDDLIKNTSYKSGDYVNVLDGNPFHTYVKTGDVQVGELGMETDVIGWYETKEALEAAIQKPNDGDIYIIGTQAPYQRRKAVVRGIDVKWADDGEYLYKVVKHFKSKAAFRRDTPSPEEGLYYSVGDEPYQLYGLVSGWDEVGSYLSGVYESARYIYMRGPEIQRGEIFFAEGQFYLCYKKGEEAEFEVIEVCEPFQNYKKHTYVQSGKKYKLREAPQLGNYEWYSPKE